MVVIVIASVLKPAHLIWAVLKCFLYPTNVTSFVVLNGTSLALVLV